MKLKSLILFLNKRPMGHITHLKKNQFKSINNYDYIIQKTLLTLREFIGSSFEETCSPLHPRMHCAKFVWNWPSGSGEKDFLISSMQFRYFVIISTLKKDGPFVLTNLNPLHPRIYCTKFCWYWPSGSGEEHY